MDVPKVVRQFRACLAKGGVTLHHVANVSGRVPLIPVPGIYLGAVANTNQVYDLWVANSVKNAKLVAEQLNRALSKRSGHPAESAHAFGVTVVAASEGSAATLTAADQHRANVISECEKALPLTS